ncbi:MAG: HEAT repeat domain-containing protein [Sandaracinus sp.]|nr:HEAT repeat domain-containing protein [Sandaracinus sp.]
MLVRSVALALLLGASLTKAQAPTAVPLSPPVPMRFEADENVGALILGRGRNERRVELPLRAPELAARAVRLAGRSVGVVELREGPKHFAVLVDARGARVDVRWTGRLDPHGDPGERRRDVLRVEDLTGDGVDDLVVGTVEEARSVCGVETVLEPRAIDPRSGELRPVMLRRLEAIAEESELAATNERPAALGDDLPLVRALVPRATTSTAGIADSVAPPPVALVDGDASTAWLEGHPGNGRWEAAIFRWAASGLDARHVALVPAAPPAASPSAVWLVHDGGRVRVRAPAQGGTWWVTLPAPISTRCLAVVLDAPNGEPASAHSGFAELRVFTEVETGGGLGALFARLAEGGREGDEAARVLALVGERALAEVATRWPDMPSAERRALIPLLERFAVREEAAALLRSAARAEDETLRTNALAACERAGEAGHRVLVGLISDPAVGDEAAVRAARVAPTLTLPAALEALSDAGGPQRPELRTALGTAAARAEGGASVVERWLLAEPPIGARASASLALASHEENRAVAAAAFRAATGADAFEDRWRLAKAAAFLPRETTETWIATLLGAEEWMLRREALLVVSGWAADESARTLVRGHLEDPYPRVRAAAAGALARLDATSHDVELLAAVARRDKWPLVRVAGIESLTAFERALPILRVGVDDPARRVRAASIDALRVRADDSAWARIDARMNDDGEWPEVIAAGIRFARERCLEAAVPTLRGAVERGSRPDAWAPDVDLAVAAIDALVAIGGAEAEAVVQSAAAESSPPPLRAAANSRERVTPCSR